MNKRGLAFTAIVRADACNFGEGIGNISVIKKKTIDGERYSYISRNALKYSLYDMLGWSYTPVTEAGSGSKKVIQYDPQASIVEYPEIDFRGYMRTKKDSSAETRSAVARISDAVSLEPYSGDLDFISNAGLARRIAKNNNLANIETHNSLYVYTSVTDLDEVGVIDGVSLVSNEEKARRVKEYLTGLEYLYRDCKGLREILAPVFLIGGVYERKNPFFLNRVKARHGELNIELLQDTIDNFGIKNDTLIGSISGMFSNDGEVKRFAPTSIREVFETLRAQVDEAYK